jgi:beta-lactamase superfamily II metal-dependent hydrolase
LNMLSVVLKVSFGEAVVLLLADSEGAADILEPDASRYAVVKIAHHGSDNGVGADAEYTIDHGVITPYSRSGLPEPEMCKKYRKKTSTMFITGGDAPILPGLRKFQKIPTAGQWTAIEIAASGQLESYLVSRSDL